MLTQNTLNNIGATSTTINVTGSFQNFANDNIWGGKFVVNIQNDSNVLSYHNRVLSMTPTRMTELIPHSDKIVQLRSDTF